MASLGPAVLEGSRTSQLVALVIVGLLLYTLYGAIYRLYLTPIAHIPGPLFARLTFWNEFYYDVVLGGKYTFVIKEYHAKYGKLYMVDRPAASRCNSERWSI